MMYEPRRGIRPGQRPQAPGPANRARDGGRSERADEVEKLEQL